MKTIQWFLLHIRCHFQPLVTFGYSWLEMAPHERQKPFHFLHTSDGKQILIIIKNKVVTCVGGGADENTLFFWTYVLCGQPLIEIRFGTMIHMKHIFMGFFKMTPIPTRVLRAPDRTEIFRNRTGPDPEWTSIVSLCRFRHSLTSTRPRATKRPTGHCRPTRMTISTMFRHNQVSRSRTCPRK